MIVQKVVATPTSVTFAGGYDPVIANASTAATAAYAPQYVCTKSDSAYTWSFSSLNRSGTQAVLKSGSNSLNYNITDATSDAYSADGSNSFAVGSAGNGANVLTYSLPCASHRARSACNFSVRLIRDTLSDLLSALDGRVRAR